MNNNQTPQQPAPQQYYYPDDEISLIDLWNTLMRRKKVLITAFAAVIVVAIIYLLLAKPVYESRAIVEIGRAGNKVVEDVNVLKQRLLAAYSGTAEFKIDALDTNPEGTKNSVRIVVHAGSLSKAKESLFRSY
ncbi:Wzz/FepE/Etk N-terminal domain-containing protein [Thiohalophilus sp.]|uniref:Wzz/FepE/Etk N-terminal domain-containing protein n=1 Tax=Thiohalophilus sp. TaxID=3028392 RepID=UPI002ACEA22F|nr:Wzz/FepE/Etk N-terminal domain-containing protein [Thiohalophilus sp.]MDZ7804370.1 Wzz/FepE/Etk N-terminal domain-containing protein [Thiohalophilus sp.]